MSDLLAIGKSGVLAYRDALSGISENVVNANNDGFARRQVKLQEQTSAAGAMSTYRNTNSFNGVRAAQTSRVWDQYRASNAWNANSESSQASVRSQYFSTIESTLDDSDAGLGVKLTAVFTSATSLSVNPEDMTLRQGMLYSLQDAAGTIRQTYGTLGKVNDTIFQQANGIVGQVNGALTTLSRLNTALKTSPAGTSARAALEDERDTLIGTLSGAMGVDLTFTTQGTVTVKLNDLGGMQVVSAGTDDPGQISIVRANDGQLTFTMTRNGVMSPVNISTGSLAGLAEGAATIAGRQLQLDGLANSFTTQFKTWQLGGLDANGVKGAPLLTGTTAATIALAVTDPKLIAAASDPATTTTPTANGNLVALKTLRGDTGIEQQWHGITADQSLKTATAKTSATSAATQKDSAYSQLDNVSGVDLDTEAADLLRFQQAYSASAKIIQTARDTFQTVLELF